MSGRGTGTGTMTRHMVQGMGKQWVSSGEGEGGWALSGEATPRCSPGALEWAQMVVLEAQRRKEEIARRRGELLARWEPEEEAEMMMTRERYEKLMVRGMGKQPEAAGRYRWCQVVRMVLSDAERSGLNDKVILEGLDAAAALVGAYLTAK